MGYSSEELLICVISELLDGVGNVAVGVSSPIPGSAALLQRALSGGETRVTVLNSRHLQDLNDGVSDLFDRAAQGRIGAFFLSGGQIDGQANINLVGIGDYPRQKVRWSGSFGSAFLYYLVPRVILFRQEHTRRTMVEKVDFISAPGVSAPGVYRPGGPYALVTSRCLFHFDKVKGRFRLTSIHPGSTLQEILDNTGFDFDYESSPSITHAPDAEKLALLRGPIAKEITDPYPKFAKSVLGIEG
ncbi:MAG: glutaconate CoA-transferase subunit B [Paracoccaceae bacterium]|jgi:glutaconate CoA-transferase subunit B